jgi:stearoyl-CoA desaturase (delta-9 desaturase)
MNLHKIFSGLNDTNIFAPTHFRVRGLQYLVHLFLIPALFVGTWENWLFGIFVFYFMFGVGSGMGAHRYWSHKSFKTIPVVENIMAFAFTIASAGSIIGYAVIHLKHHQYSDNKEDPHSPQHVSFWKAWLGLFKKENLSISPKSYKRFIQDPILRFYHKYFFLVILAYVSGLMALGIKYFLFGYCVPVVINFHANSFLIVLCHNRGFGYRNFDTKDVSYNLFPWFKLLLLGEEMHNNHHHRPTAVNLNIRKKWHEVDLLYPLICLVRTNRTQNASSSVLLREPSVQ